MSGKIMLTVLAALALTAVLRVTDTVDAEREVAPKNGPMNCHLFLLVFTDPVIDRSAATTECCIPEFYGKRGEWEST